MTKVRLSAFITGLSGSMGGSTFQNSGGGLTVKNKGFQRRTYSTGKAETAAIMSNINKDWRDLSQVSRDTWNAFSQFAPIAMKNNPDRFINGQQYFNKYATWFFQQFGNSPGVPTMTTEVVPTPFVEVSNNAGVLTVIADQNIDEAVIFIQFKISGPMQATQRRPKSGTKQIICVFAASTTCDITSMYQSLYGYTLQTGDTCFIEYRTISATQPFWSNPISIKITVG